MTRRRVRLTAKDWQQMYLGVSRLLELAEGCPIGALTAEYPSVSECRQILRKIGVHGLAAARRGVAPVRRRAGARRAGGTPA